jgi:hypothetical protein
MTKWDKKKKLYVTAISLGTMVISTFIIFYPHRPPTINIDEPQNNITIQKGAINIVGSITPKDTLLKINNVVVKNIDGTFTHPISLSEGENTIKISAESWFRKEINLVITRELTQAEKDEKIADEKLRQEKVRIAEEKVLAKQRAWEASKAGQIYKAHPEWSKEDCERVANGKIWIGMTYTMLVYEMGRPDTKNLSNYGSGSEWQYCWHGWDPSCFYDTDDDGIIEAYN